MTLSEKRKASNYMKSLMADKDAKYSIYPLYKDNVINWLVFRQLMMKYFGCVKDDDKLTPEQMKYIQKWGKRFKKKRDAEMNRVLTEMIGEADI